MSAHHTITELAREFDITPRAIRFYEDQGLLAPSREGAGGQRRVYSGHDRTRLKLTLRGKRLGFTLTEIRRLLDLYESPTDTVPQLRAFLALIAEHRAVLDRQLEDLTATLEDLSQYEAQCKMLLDGSASSDAADTAEAADADAGGGGAGGAGAAGAAGAASAAGADASDGADAANAARGG